MKLVVILVIILACWGASLFIPDIPFHRSPRQRAVRKLFSAHRRNAL